VGFHLLVEAHSMAIALLMLCKAFLQAYDLFYITQLSYDEKVLEDVHCWQQLHSILTHEYNGVFFCEGQEQVKLNNKKKCLKGKITEVRC
jgi:hypothetical protein